MKRCRHCKVMFEPTMSSLQICCSYKCAAAWTITIKGQQHVAKEKRKDIRARKLAIKTKSDWTRETQQTFNAFIRERDYDQPCISCGKPATYETNQWDCGHYRSVGASPELRFVEDNAHKQCKKCNRNLSGNVVEYRLRLIDRIGIRKLNWLEGPHEMPNLIIKDLIHLKAKYKTKKRQLQDEREYQQKGV
tara:strand:+ start:1674 stop:2246 length:573 start_codon:yes stop_codon:yes gene_type:complete